MSSRAPAERRLRQAIRGCTTWRSSTKTPKGSRRPCGGCSTTATRVDSARHHGGAVSVYLRDPDGNGVELYYDCPRERWTDAAGRLVLANEPLDIDTILNASAG
jgi:hypothetical protein